MAVFLPLYERINLGYNENEVTQLLYDQMDVRVQDYNNENIDFYVFIYISSLISAVFFYTVYLIIT